MLKGRSKMIIFLHLFSLATRCKKVQFRTSVFFHLVKSSKVLAANKSGFTTLRPCQNDVQDLQ